MCGFGGGGGCCCCNGPLRIGHNWECIRHVAFEFSHVPFGPLNQSNPFCEPIAYYHPRREVDESLQPTQHHTPSPFCLLHICTDSNTIQTSFPNSNNLKSHTMNHRSTVDVLLSPIHTKHSPPMHVTHLIELAKHIFSGHKHAYMLRSHPTHSTHTPDRSYLARATNVIDTICGKRAQHISNRFHIQHLNVK